MTPLGRIAIAVLATVLATAATWPLTNWGWAYWSVPWVAARAWRSDRRLLGWLLAHQLVLQTCIWSTQPVGTNGDTHGYLETAAANLQGQPGYFPPGYGLWLWFWQAAAGPFAGHTTTAAQHLLFIVGLALLVDVARRCLSLAVAVAGAVLAGGLSPMLLMPQSVLSENLTFAAMVGTLWATHRATLAGSKRGTLHWQWGAGILLGIGALVRQVPLPVLLPAVWLLLQKARPGRAALAGTARIGGMAAGSIAIAVCWFWVADGRPGLTTGSGAHLFNRVIHEQRLLDPHGEATQQLLGELGVDAAMAPHWDVSNALLARGYDWDEAMSLMRAAAMEGLRAAPWEFVRYTFGLAWRQYRNLPLAPIPRGSQDPIRTVFDASSLLGSHPSLRQTLDRQFAELWPWLLWIPCIGLVWALLCSKHRTTVAALGAILPAYLLLSSAAEFENPRFTVAVLPFAMVFATAPLAWRRVAPARGTAASPPAVEASAPEPATMPADQARPRAARAPR